MAQAMPQCAAHDDSKCLLTKSERAVSVTAILQATVFRLSVLLRQNWEQLAMQIGFNEARIQNFRRAPHPLGEVMTEWLRHPELHPTLGRLLTHITQINKAEVFEDSQLMTSIKSDVQQYSILNLQCRNDKGQENRVPSIEDLDRFADEFRCLTTHDVDNEYPTYYDAYISAFTEGEDFLFVKNLLEKLERNHNFTCVLPVRDLLPGMAYFPACAHLMQSRCKRTIAVISSKYLASESCAFDLRFLTVLTPASRSKRMIPVQIEPCRLPSFIRNTVKIDFTNPWSRDWVWNRLVEAVRAPLHMCSPETRIQVEAYEPPSNYSASHRSDASISGETESLPSASTSSTSDYPPSQSIRREAEYPPATSTNRAADYPPSQSTRSEADYPPSSNTSGHRSFHEIDDEEKSMQEACISGFSDLSVTPDDTFYRK